MTLFKIFTLVLFLIINVFGQEGTEVIATIGSKSITKDEFKYRYEFTPQINRKYSNANNAKEEFLYTLIA